MPYLLDAQTCLALLADVPSVRQRYEPLSTSCFTSSLVYADLYSAACTLPDEAARLADLERLQNFLYPIDFDRSHAREYSRIVKELRAGGHEPPRLLAALVAAIARATKSTLVTAEPKVFQPIGGLRVENWFSSL
jgi:predicted nucleic acid-binding protein